MPELTSSNGWTMQSRERVDACLDWIEKATWPDGGVAAWIDLPLMKKGPPYPEVTGYLIPTLKRWGKDELAEQYAKWLVKVQEPEGYWLGIDKLPHNFDTAMCLHGLRSIVGNRKIARAARRAERFLWEQVRDGAMTMQPGTEYAPFYCVLASAYIQTAPVYWIKRLAHEAWPWKNPERMHYILYGLAGLQSLNVDVSEWLDQIRDLPQPLKFWYEKDWGTHKMDPRVDLCANAQAAILLKTRSYLAVCEAEQQDCGGILEHPGATRCTSWTAKYYLDAMYKCMRGEM